MSPRALSRAPFLAVAMLSMLSSVWLGLARLGWPLPLPSSSSVLLHAPLLFGGFFGTLITLERAVALGRRWPHAGPALTAAGAVLLALGAVPSAMAATTAGSGVLLAASLAAVAHQTTLHAVTMALGAALWLAGNGWWLAGGAVFQVAYWWIGFVVLTIAGERLELNRMLQPRPGVRAWFVAALVVCVAGVVLTAAALDAGARLTGLGLVVLAAWLARHDLARRTVRQKGLTRFMAVALLAGYFWLAAGGAIALTSGGLVAGPRYDAMLHAVLLGFVMSMVFAHAPVIFPAILGVPLPYRPVFYAHLTLLHVSVAIRVAGGLAADAGALRAWGGLLNAAALLLFVGLTAASVALGPPGRGRP